MRKILVLFLVVLSLGMMATTAFARHGGQPNHIRATGIVWRGAGW